MNIKSLLLVISRAPGSAVCPPLHAEHRRSTEVTSLRGARGVV